MSGLGSGDGRRNGLDITHFTEHDDVRRLAQGRAQGAGKAGSVAGHFALADDALLMRVQVFDRVFDRDDVAAAGGVDLVHQAGQGCTLTVAGRACDQDHAAAVSGQAHHDVRNVAVLGIRDAERNRTAGHGQGAALTVGVAAEAAQIAHGEGEVVVALDLQGFPVTPGQFVCPVDQHGDVRRQGFLLRDGNHFAARLGHDLGAGNDKDIGTVILKRFSQDIIKCLYHSQSSSGSSTTSLWDIHLVRCFSSSGSTWTMHSRLWLSRGSVHWTLSSSSVMPSGSEAPTFFR